MLKMSQITKRYAAAVALEQADLDVAPGQVMALLGENGAGKSTLMKILAGLETPELGNHRNRRNDAAARFPRTGQGRGGRLRGPGVEHR